MKPNVHGTCGKTSFYLEAVATEFDVQGLELDWTCVTWDADFRYTGLADSYVLLPLFSETSTVEVKAIIKAATAKALGMDPQLAEAHKSQAVFLAIYEWNCVEAETEFRRAIELNPNYATAHQWLESHWCAVA